MNAAVAPRPGSTGDLAIQHLKAFGPCNRLALAFAIDKPEDELHSMLGFPIRQGLIAFDGSMYRVGDGVPLPGATPPPAPAPASRAGLRQTRPTPAPTPEPAPAPADATQRATWVGRERPARSPFPPTPSIVVPKLSATTLKASQAAGVPPAPPPEPAGVDIDGVHKADGTATHVVGVDVGTKADETVIAVFKAADLSPAAAPPAAIDNVAARTVLQRMAELGGPVPPPLPSFSVDLTTGDTSMFISRAADAPAPFGAPAANDSAPAEDAARLTDLHRLVIEAAGATTRMQARELLSAALPALEVKDFEVARFSDGRLVLQLDGVLFVLKRLTAARLYAYLDGHELDRA